jgi:HAD superfamily hydrolase (TIGR01509 family)
MKYLPPPAPLQAVVFDLDGLIVNTEDLFEVCGNELLAIHGHAMTNELREQMIGRPALEALQRMINYFQLTDTPQQLAAESEVIMRRLMNSDLKLMSGLLPLLEELDSSQVPRAVATSSGSTYAAEILHRFELARHFRFVLSCEDVMCGKPDPEIYQEAASRLGVATENMMVLEDSANGCRAALAAGAYTVAVPNDHTRVHPFHGVHLVADSLADPRILDAIGL